MDSWAHGFMDSWTPGLLDPPAPIPARTLCLMGPGSKRALGSNGTWAQTGPGPNGLWAQTGSGPKQALGPNGPWVQMEQIILHGQDDTEHHQDDSRQGPSS